MINHMTRPDQVNFREVLRAKQAELSHNSQGLQRIAVERSADVLEEAQYKSDRELAIVILNREASLRRGVATALLRIHDGTFGLCEHCGNDISPRRLEAVLWAPLWAPLCIRCQEAADRGEERVLASIEETFLDAA